MTISPGVTRSFEELCRARFTGRMSESPSRSTLPSSGSSSSEDSCTRKGTAGAGADMMIAILVELCEGSSGPVRG